MMPLGHLVKLSVRSLYIGRRSGSPAQHQLAKNCKLMQEDGDRTRGLLGNLLLGQCVAEMIDSHEGAPAEIDDEGNGAKSIRERVRFEGRDAGSMKESSQSEPI
jgi:hypothetical protein